MKEWDDFKIDNMGYYWLGLILALFTYIVIIFISVICSESRNNNSRVSPRWDSYLLLISSYATGSNPILLTNDTTGDTSNNIDNSHDKSNEIMPIVNFVQ